MDNEQGQELPVENPVNFARPQGLNTSKVLALLDTDGCLSCNLKGFEPRQQQRAMMKNILDSYNHEAISLIEAGTGTGKTIAYLIPAILWALQRKERTLISTHTITLQEQLITKDIPLLAKALKVDIKAVLVKGMSNYVCLRKVEDSRQESLLMSKEELAEFDALEAWAETTDEGSKASLKKMPSIPMWDRISAESDTCSHTQCSHYQKCFFFKARRLAEEAQIIVANHHLLFADLAIRAETDNYKNSAIIPYCSRIIFDEAHHIEDVATDFFGCNVNKLKMLRALGKIASEKQNQGKLPAIRDKLQQCYPDSPPPAEVSSLLSRLHFDLFTLRRDAQTSVNEAFQTLREFVKTESFSRERSESLGEEDLKLRLLNSHYVRDSWQTGVIPIFKKLMGSVQRYLQALSALENDMKELKNERFQEQTKNSRLELSAFTSRLANQLALLEQFVLTAPKEEKVYWIELNHLKMMTNVSLVDAALDISKAMVDFLFSRFSTIVLCSATLSTNQQFDFICKRLGITSKHLPEKKIETHIYDSPFNYAGQALLIVPTDLPPPQHKSFIPVAVEQIWQAIQASKGGAFVLFTSYGMLQQCYELLASRLSESRYEVFKQGDANRQELLIRFKRSNHSVLFGTDSFWEGVDVAGEALRCVIIVKLPFKVPTEPVIQARTEAILACGGNPFFEYTLPNAIVKFKQGVGRLIRNKKDRGCIVCLDVRLLQKAYGRLFFNSLPGFQQCFIPSSQMEQQMREFYRKTYHYTIRQN